MKSSLNIKTLSACFVTGLGLVNAPVWADGGESHGPPPTSLDLYGRYLAESNLGKTGAKASQYDTGVGAYIPFSVTDRLSLSARVGVSYLGYEFHNFSSLLPGHASPLNSAISARVAPGFSYAVNDSWRLFGSGQWQFAGQDGASVQRATLWGAFAGASYQWTPNFNVFVGVAYSQRFYRSSLVLPVAGFDWQINEQWNLALRGDNGAANSGGLKLSYRWDESWTFFGRGGYAEREVRLSPKSSIADGSVRFRGAPLEIGTDYHFNQNVTVSVFAGAMVGQDYTFTDAQRHRVLKQNASVAPTVGGVFQVSF